MGDEWRKMHLCLNTKCLLFIYPNSGRVLDSVPLHESAAVAKAADVNETSSTAMKFLGKRNSSIHEFGIGSSPKSASIQKIRVQATARDLSQQEIVLSAPDPPNPDLPKDDIRSKHNDACLSIETTEDGYNAGRPYLVRFSNEEESDEWLHAIVKARKEAMKTKFRGQRLLRLQRVLRRAYNTDTVAALIIFLIWANFVCAGTKS